MNTAPAYVGTRRGVRLRNRILRRDRSAAARRARSRKRTVGCVCGREGLTMRYHRACVRVRDLVPAFWQTYDDGLPF